MINHNYKKLLNEHRMKNENFLTLSAYWSERAEKATGPFVFLKNPYAVHCGIGLTFVNE